MEGGGLGGAFVGSLGGEDSPFSPAKGLPFELRLEGW